MGQPDMAPQTKSGAEPSQRMRRSIAGVAQQFAVRVLVDVLMRGWDHRGHVMAKAIDIFTGLF